MLKDCKVVTVICGNSKNLVEDFEFGNKVSLIQTVAPLIVGVDLPSNSLIPMIENRFRDNKLGAFKSALLWSKSFPILFLPVEKDFDSDLLQKMLSNGGSLIPILESTDSLMGIWPSGFASKIKLSDEDLKINQFLSSFEHLMLN